MTKRNATAAVIGAGDYIGSEIAKKFASEGFTIFAGRRNGDKLAPLVKEVEVGATMDLFAAITAAAPQVAVKPEVAPGQSAQQPKQGAGNGQGQKTEPRCACA